MRDGNVESRPSFEIPVIEIKSGHATMALSGELDSTGATAPRDCLALLLSAGPSRIVIDLEGLSFIDSSGLGDLVGGLRQARDVSGNVVLSRPNGFVLHVLELTGVIDVVEIVDAPGRPADE
jgi:anti-sigma B factor antagonist